METVEPWLRGTHGDVAVVQRAVVHALQLAREDVLRWCGPLQSDEVERKPYGLPSVGFQLRHIARSLDRLMTYAEGAQLSAAQLDALHREAAASGDAVEECVAAVDHTLERVTRIQPDTLDAMRVVGRDRLPTTVAGLLIHVAEHTQRHVGQAITTAKLALALRDG